MPKYKVCLIGTGRMGKIFIKEIKYNKNYSIIKSLNHREIRKNPKIVNETIKSKKINLVIIASPINTHYKYLQWAYKHKKNIIIEKPIVENISQLNQIKKLNNNFKKKIMIHHNDVINFQRFKYLKSTKNITKINMIYGKNDKKNYYKKPFFDWLAHPLSFIINFIGQPITFKIIEYKNKCINNTVKETLKIEFTFNEFKVYLTFSNNLKIKSKKITILYKNFKYKYDGYKKKNYQTVKILLSKFEKENMINDIDKNIEVYKLLFMIDRRLKKLQM